MVKNYIFVFLTWACLAGMGGQLCAANPAEDYYRLITLPLPEDVAFEVSGLDLLPDGRMVAAIRKGEIWVVENPYDDTEPIHYTRIAEGLHEPLGVLYQNGSLFVAQYTELTELRDATGNGQIDTYLTVVDDWGVTGNYHEYAYGPKLDGAGNMWVTLNLTIGRAITSNDAWRGWSLKITPDRTMIPVSSGLRSPSGLGANAAGDMFLTDQEGNWVPTCSLHHIETGDFHGHVSALKSAGLPGSTIERPKQIAAGLPLPEAKTQMPMLKLPAVWFPYRKTARGTTDVVCDLTGGRFGPFTNQLFVGEFTMSRVVRVQLEKVKGQYQGAVFPFRHGFQSGVVRLAFGRDGSLFVGQTNRGWNSEGHRSYGLERLVWSGKMPFEIREMRARPDGFELEFTRPLDRTSASRTDSYRMKSYTYLYHQDYGSPEIDTRNLLIRSAVVAEDGKTVHLTVEGLREVYVHELHLTGVRCEQGAALLNDAAYYTLNQLP